MDLQNIRDPAPESAVDQLRTPQVAAKVFIVGR